MKRRILQELKKIHKEEVSYWKGFRILMKIVVLLPKFGAGFRTQ